jgi:hypothetical protein
MSSDQDTDVTMPLDTVHPRGNPFQDWGTGLDSKISDPAVESSSAREPDTDVPISIENAKAKLEDL